MQILDLVNEYEAAKYLTVSVSTLRAWRIKGNGPRYHKIGGSVRYSQSDLLRFIISSKRD